jgi:DNA-binding transcriptional ArsR family regulator
LKYRKDSMNGATAIGAFGALAHQHRLAIYRALVKRGSGGLAAGAIGERVGLLPSSLTFHLQSLQRAGLIQQRRDGRQLIYSADFAAMNALLSYLTDNCCAESGESCATVCLPSRGESPARRRKAA